MARGCCRASEKRCGRGRSERRGDNAGPRRSVCVRREVLLRMTKDLRGHGHSMVLRRGDTAAF